MKIAKERTEGPILCVFAEPNPLLDAEREDGPGYQVRFIPVVSTREGEVESCDKRARSHACA